MTRRPSAALGDDFDELCASVAAAQPWPSRGLCALLQMREADPFASQELAMQLSRDVGLGRSIEASYFASAHPKPSERPFSARDVIDYWGYRVIHSTSVLNGLAKFLGGESVLEPHRDFWLRAATVATYAGVLSDVLKLHADQGFAGSLLRDNALFLLRQHRSAEALAAHRLAVSNQTPLWEAETELLGGSHLDLGRSLGERWGFTEALLEAFASTDQPDSLPDLLMRSTAAAERHGFQDPAGASVPPHLRKDREPILDAYFRNGGGTPDAFIDSIRGMLALTPLIDLEDVA